MAVILWDVYPSWICFLLFSSFPLVLFHYISDLGHVIGRCSAQVLLYLLTYSDSRRLSEIVSYWTLVKNELWESLLFRFSLFPFGFLSSWSLIIINDWRQIVKGNPIEMTCLLWKGPGCGQDFLEEGGRSWSDSSLAVRGMPGCFIVISYHFFLTRGCQMHHKAPSHQLCFRSKPEGRVACFF